MNSPKIYIIILNWNGLADTKECLDSLRNVNYNNYCILVVDNGSYDNSVKYIKENYPEVRVIENNVNLGFAEGNNVGIRIALKENADYVLLLNNDTIVDPHFINHLIKNIDQKSDIGVVGPIIYQYDKKDVIQSAGIIISWNNCGQHIIMANQKYNRPDKTPIDADFVSGCALLARREVFKDIGLFEQKFFLYWEETDLCTRIKKAGYRIQCIPEASIWHKGLATTKRYKGLTAYYMTRNRFWFMKRHATPSQYVSFIIYFIVYKWMLDNCLYLFYSRDWSSFKSFNKGVIDGITNSA